MNIDKSIYLSKGLTESQAKEFAEERFTDFDDKFYTSVLKFKMWVSENIDILARISFIALVLVYAVFVHCTEFEVPIPDSLSSFYHCGMVWIAIWGFIVAATGAWRIFYDLCCDNLHSIKLRTIEIILGLIVGITYTIIKF